MKKIIITELEKKNILLLHQDKRIKKTNLIFEERYDPKNFTNFLNSAPLKLFRYRSGFTSEKLVYVDAQYGREHKFITPYPVTEENWRKLVCDTVKEKYGFKLENGVVTQASYMPQSMGQIFSNDPNHILHKLKKTPVAIDNSWDFVNLNNNIDLEKSEPFWAYPLEMYQLLPIDFLKIAQEDFQQLPLYNTAKNGSLNDYMKRCLAPNSGGQNPVQGNKNTFIQAPTVEQVKDCNNKKSIKYGMSGDSVQEIQNMLMNLDNTFYDVNSIAKILGNKSDKYFGKKTKKAVETFQTKTNELVQIENDSNTDPNYTPKSLLLVDGKVGCKTYEYLKYYSN